ncbi:MAG: zinc ribbon domain-containing protein [Clostridia bacterium]|nr:zinc ribbon domain-containing protein [Clostridia bacterium]
MEENELMEKKQEKILDKAIEENEYNEIKECLNCGAKLSQKEEFCSKCGMRKGEYKKILCKNCKTELQLKQKFCPKCGAKSEAEIGIDGIVNSVKKGYRTKIRKLSIKKVLILVIILAIIAALIIGGKKIISEAMVSIDDLMAEGQYWEAYEKAKDNEKDQVVKENQLAVLSNEISEGLKNPSSFSLTAVWFDSENKRIVLDVSGTNSYGGVVSSYYYYTYSTEKNKYTLYCTLSSLEREEAKSYDTTDEKLEKILKNSARTIVKEIISNSNYKIQSKHINNINKLFKNGKLNEITLIEIGKEM